MANSMFPTNVTTPPSFYTPFTTPSSMQIPTNRKEEYIWAQWFYDNEPKVAAAIEFYTDFPLSGFHLECANSRVLEYFEERCAEWQLNRFFPLLSHEFHLRGDAFPLASLNCPKCNGRMVDLETGEPCEHEGASWTNITLLNPDTIEVMPTMMGMEPRYFAIPSDDMRRIIQERRPIEVYNAIPEDVVMYVLANQPIPLAPLSIYHFKRGAAQWQPFGRSMVRRLFPTLVYKDKLRQAQYMIAERHILPVKIAKVGTPERPANANDLMQVREMFAQVANDPLCTIVTHTGLDIDYVGASGKVLTVTNDFEQIDQDIYDAFMINKAMLNGEGPTAANANVGIASLKQRLERFRGEVKWWFENKILKPEAEWQGYVTEGRRGEKEIIYPRLVWDDLQITDNTGKLQVMVQLKQLGDISSETMLEELDIPYDQEVERLRFENSATIATTPDLAMPGIGNGFRGPVGDAAGAAGGMPPMGGGIPPAGGEMPPGGEMPAAPGGAQAGGIPAAMPAMAETADEAYRRVAELMQDMQTERVASFEQNLQTRYAEKGFRSAAHEQFEMSFMPVTGRHELGPIPMLWDGNGIAPGPYLGGSFAEPLNAAANGMRTSAMATGALNANKSPQRAVHFNRLEQKLYSLLQRLPMPIPLFAQYVAGPDSRAYTLDAAYPTIKLGVEADGEVFHNNPDAIDRDRKRDSQLASQGWHILRFREDEINEKGDQVAAVIMQTAQKLLSHRV